MYRFVGILVTDTPGAHSELKARLVSSCTLESIEKKERERSNVGVDAATSCVCGSLQGDHAVISCMCVAVACRHLMCVVVCGGACNHLMCVAVCVRACSCLM